MSDISTDEYAITIVDCTGGRHTESIISLKAGSTKEQANSVLDALKGNVTGDIYLHERIHVQISEHTNHKTNDDLNHGL